MFTVLSSKLNIMIHVPWIWSMWCNLDLVFTNEHKHLCLQGRFVVELVTQSKSFLFVCRLFSPALRHSPLFSIEAFKTKTSRNITVFILIWWKSVVIRSLLIQVVEHNMIDVTKICSLFKRRNMRASISEAWLYVPLCQNELTEWSSCETYFEMYRKQRIRAFFNVDLFETTTYSTF